jgi:hypothetical protein
VPTRSDRIARAYFGLLAAALAGWWVLLFAWPAARAPFRIAGAPESALLAFAPADLLAALAAAWVSTTSAGHARTAAAWAVAGAMSYAAVYTAALAFACAAGPLGVILMAPAAAAGVWSARALQRCEA